MAVLDLGKRLAGKPAPDFEAGLWAAMQRRWVRAQIRVPHLPIEMFFAVLQAAVDIKTSVANRALDDRQSL